MKKHISKKVSNHLKIILVITFILFISIVYILFIIRRDQFRNYIKAMNISAGVHYKTIAVFSNYKNKINIPEQGVYYVLGDCSDDGSYRAFKNDFINDDKIIYGNDFETGSIYWAIKIKNGKIIESWSSYYPLQEKQLVEYSEEEQLKELTIIKKFNKSKLIGYYKNN